MKKLLSVLLTLTLVGSLCIGCSKAPEDNGSTSETKTSKSDSDKDGTTLTFVQHMSGVITDELQAVLDEFKAETGITVELSSPGSDIEEVMKTRMASNTLPDLWTTHGWSVARYGEYLRPMNDQAFVEHIVPSIKDLITGPDGNIYVLPIDADICGISYNATVLEEAGVDPESILTWEDFEVACEKIKAIGKVPLFFDGKDPLAFGQFFDFVAPTLYTNDEENNQREQFLDGSFDWEKWREVCEILERWTANGYLNTDALTADYMTACQSLGSGDAAFMLRNANVIVEAWTTNPDAKLGILPIPGKDSDNSRCVIGGERLAVGVWKDSPYIEEALQLIEYLSQPEVCSRLATVAGMPAGLDTAESDTGKLEPYYERVMSDDILTIPYFDREYLPSGMWDDLCVTGASIVAGNEGAIDDTIDQMRQSYEDKMAQK
ncbi:ABC transporter substrate-binding protein [Ohessyouella blattaphilus]|uniref:ABC transporter substrate-binding protein n=1 Tax=Ohessyouella blattaphilus TaxID=2949333 RepID=A0ABT1EL70_9FIRM|nr:ABC transporter substrate-binding protein [Ohessyouella blattaphilus]MCP1111440.1 ABC transporter substrate-binding protein [Ohessyouella blattaphilus]MCR8564834.1 ABC transporter substrate-binding protein [Ohessyouella blattaphilus]